MTEHAGAAAIVFWIVAGISVVSAFLTILSARPIRSAVFLLTNILSLAVLYVLLDAHLLGALQVIVYAGAVVVLFVFVIMLLGPSIEAGRQRRLLVTRTVGSLALLGLGGVAGWAVWAEHPEATLPDGFGTVRAVASAMFGDNVFVFEAVSVLLLVAIVGAVAVAKGRSGDSSHHPEGSAGGARR